MLQHNHYDIIIVETLGSISWKGLGGRNGISFSINLSNCIQNKYYIDDSTLQHPFDFVVHFVFSPSQQEVFAQWTQKDITIWLFLIIFGTQVEAVQVET